MTTSTAPGKVILFGEHAVVYARPAIAAPVFQVQAQATIAATERDRVEIDAPDIARRYDLESAAPEDPIAAIIRLTCAQLGVEPKRFSVRVSSSIPVARGLGSGAAVSVAVARALMAFFNFALSADQVSALAYQVEKLYHGTPSGIDNTVIAFAQPIYYVRGQPFESFRVARPFLIAIADTGIASPTKIAVGDVRRAWEQDRARYEALFDEIGSIARAARRAIESGDVGALGPLMNANQEQARAIGVSSPEIEKLIAAALGAGGRGAKLSGAGRGGNIIALIEEGTRPAVEHTLLAAGAARVVITEVR
ncbi:MAG: mevalonate kinase [Chloroflexi bacterium]|nr:mevalonate kinase [Chloroflexota bacterium]